MANGLHKLKLGIFDAKTRNYRAGLSFTTSAAPPQAP